MLQKSFNMFIEKSPATPCYLKGGAGLFLVD